MKSPIHQDTRIAAFAEEQMRTWGRLQETAASRPEPADLTSGQGYVTSPFPARPGRGRGRARIGGRAPRLGGVRQNLLDQVAQRYKESRLMLDLVDETKSNWVYDVLGTWMDRQVIPHEKYVIQVNRMIQFSPEPATRCSSAAGRNSFCRGTRLCRANGGPEAFRAERVRQRHDTGLPEALDWIHRTDRGRHEYIQRFFRRDINNPHLYDW